MNEIINWINSNSGFIMALTSIMMLVVSGFLAWNAIIMMKVSYESNKLSMWQLRYKSFISIVKYRDELFKSIEKYSSIDDPRAIVEAANLEPVEFMCNQGILLFHSNEEIRDYLDKLSRKSYKIWQSFKYSEKSVKNIADEIRGLNDWMFKNDGNALTGMTEYLKL